MKLVVSNQQKKHEPNLALLEYVLVTHFRPTFLHIEPPDMNGDIQIILSCINFQYIPIQKRVTDVFNLINDKYPEILKDRLILVQAYDTIQMEQLLTEVFK